MYARDFRELVKSRKNVVIQLYNDYADTNNQIFHAHARAIRLVSFDSLSYKSNLFIRSNYNLRLII